MEDCIGADTENVAALIARVTKGLTAEQQSYALLKQGRALMEQENYDSALEVLNKAVSLHVSVNNFVARAACFEKILSWEDAYFDYCFAIRLDPDSGVAFGHRGLCLAKMQKFDIAMEDLTKACQMEPSNANYYNRASVGLDASMYHSALKDANHILRNEASPPSTALRQRCVYLKGLIGIELGYFDAVITDMRALLIANPNVGATRALLARAYRLKGDCETAETQMSFAIAVDGSNPENYIERANARTALGSTQSITDAVADLDLAIRLLMRPVGQNSQTVRRMSRQSSDLLPALITMSSREFSGKRAPPQLPGSHVVEQHRGVFGPSVNPLVSNRKQPSREGVGGSAISSDTAFLRPQSALPRSGPSICTPLLAQSRISRVSSMESCDSDSNCPSTRGSADGDRTRRPKFSRSASMAKREGLSELAGERSLAKRLQSVARVLCQRAETRLLLIAESLDVQSSLNIKQKSLHDSIKAVELAPAADDLKVTLASCLVHLEEYDKAISVLKDVLSRHPRSVRARYRLAMSYKGKREFRSSIDTLNKIVSDLSIGAFAQCTDVPKHNEGEQHGELSGVSMRYILPRNSPKYSVPGSRACTEGVGEKEGSDVLITAQSERNDRINSGDALGDESGVDDISALDSFGSISPAKVLELRGSIFMELQSHSLALTDFGKAIVLDPRSPHVYLMRALCHRDLGRFELALTDFKNCESRCFGDRCTLETARASVHRLLKDWNSAKMCLQSAIDAAPAQADQTRTAYLKAQLAVVWIELGNFKEALDTASAAMPLVSVPRSRYINEKVNLLSKASRRVSDVIKFAKLDSTEVISLKLEWILRYHSGLAHYKLKSFHQFVEVVSCCVSVLADFSPDALSIGILYFFLGVSASLLKRYKEAIIFFNQALNSAWSTLHDCNQVLCLFARGKIYQILGENEAALSNYNEALRLDPHNAHVLFRRGWLYKSGFHDYGAAGADFETARRLMPGDPNFTVDYKHIMHVTFVALESDPDVTADFPTLSNLHDLGGGHGENFG